MQFSIKTAMKKLRLSKSNAIFLFFFASITTMEFFVKITIYKSFFDTGLIYIPMFSAAAALIITLICTLATERANRVIALIMSAALGVFYSFQYIYFNTFKSFFVFETLGLAGDVMDFWRETLMSILKNSYALIFFMLPFLFMLIFGKKLFIIKKFSGRKKLACAVGTVLIHLLTVAVIMLHTGDYSDSYFYSSVLSTGDAVSRFGVITTARLDIKQTVFGRPNEAIDNPYESADVNDVLAVNAPADSSDNGEQPQSEAEYNVMNIDFDKLMNSTDHEYLKELDQYFKSVEPTAKNQYTGMFKGKNLVYLTLEGFSYKCIDKERTPTLYKMATEGFVFENYYNSLWGGSTATGEYAAMTGNFYTSANCLGKSADKYMPFALGNQFKGAGYGTYAYHDHTSVYYDRNLSHPNMGYEFKASDNGLEGLTESWPRSDKEMADLSVKDYIGETPFHVYYMTVSGHGNYSWSANAMSSKNRDRVKDLPYSENVKAYLACNLEVEDMLTALIKYFDEAGILEDTVFAMNADHYPYLLSDDELAELYSLPKEDIRSNFELYRNGFLLWSASMKEPVKVSTPCSSIDIVPTLLNLFGMEYDSRLIMGTDILSGTDPVVILNCLGSGGSWHWISSLGSYNTLTRQFTPNEQCTLSGEKLDEYVSLVNKLVQSKRNCSIKILDLDYYRHVFPDGIEKAKEQN